MIDCWKKDDERITQQSGQNRLGRIMYRLKYKYNGTLLTDWTFKLSDHCLLQLTLKPELRQPTRRTVSLPTYILEDERIEKAMIDFVEMISEHGTASLRLEFLKTSLRSVVGECSKDRNRREKVELEKIQRELQLKMTIRELYHFMP